MNARRVVVIGQAIVLCAMLGIKGRNAQLNHKVLMQNCCWGTCQLVFDDELALLEHCKQHTQIGQKKCEWQSCDHVAARKSCLLVHLLTHIPVRKYQCEECDKLFKRKQDLKKHQVKLHLYKRIPVQMLLMN